MITGTVVLTGVFLFVANTAHAAETLQQLGSDNAYSAGAIQTVQPGYGLTAIG